jgi:hypothetical protein
MKVLAPNVIVALKEALTNIYWYKGDLKTFLMDAVRVPEILARMDWQAPKRETAHSIVELLRRNEDRFHAVLVKLVQDVATVSDFSHLERVIDGGAEKAQRARETVQALRTYAQPLLDSATEKDASEARKQRTLQEIIRRHGIESKIAEMKTHFYSAISAVSPQQRGFALEKFLRQLFELFDMDPKASFRIVGEQIDGAFSYDGTDYLMEAKWEKGLIAAEALDIFDAKVRRKLENTLGLFLAINGFAPTGLEAFSRSRPQIILMDGADLTAILESRISLPELLFRKKRHASETGEIYLSATRIVYS